MKFEGIFSICIVVVGAIEFDRLGVHKETLDNLVFGNEALIKEKYPMRSATACAIFCRKHAVCVSFNVNIYVEKCRIYSSALYRTEDGVAEPGWKYYVFGDAECRLKDGFIYSQIHQICIHVSTQIFLYESGNQYCSEKGSSLISLESLEKFNAVADMLSKMTMTGPFFIGLKYSNGQWIWQNGAVLGPEANWGSTRSGYWCTVVVKDWGYKYRDSPCNTYKERVMCEYILQ